MAPLPGKVLTKPTATAFSLLNDSSKLSTGYPGNSGLAFCAHISGTPHTFRSDESMTFQRYPSGPNYSRRCNTGVNCYLIGGAFDASGPDAKVGGNSLGGAITPP